MTDIATFGCSFTYGVGKEYHSWAEEFAHMYPQYNVKNYSMGGTSVKWSMSQLLQQNTLTSKVVFQLTAPQRITLSDQRMCYADNRIQKTSNYSLYDGDTALDVIIFNPQTIERPHRRHTAAEVSALHKVLLTSMDFDMEHYEWKMYIDHAVAHSDFAYFHKANDAAHYIDMGGKPLPCVETHFGKAQFDEWVYDKGYHFGIDGSQEVARWIKSNLKM